MEYNNIRKGLLSRALSIETAKKKLSMKSRQRLIL
jgi:hypothetical protein